MAFCFYQDPADLASHPLIFHTCKRKKLQKKLGLRKNRKMQMKTNILTRKTNRTKQKRKTSCGCWTNLSLYPKSE